MPSKFGSDLGLALAGAGTAISILGDLSAAHNAERAAVTTAGTIAQTSELNAELIEQGAELNAGVHDFNAAALEGQSKDAIARGKEQEYVFRKQIKGVIGSERVNFAAQGVEVSDGSALEVQEDTARQGELDAIQIRVNAAREAWGYSVSAQGEREQAASTRKLGTLQAANVRQVGKAAALNARVTGQNQASAQNWGAATSLVSGASAILLKKFGS